MEYLKEYGVQRTMVKGKWRWRVFINNARTDLDYARKEFALKKAGEFVRACYRNFVRDNGEHVTFKFKQVEY